MPTNEERREVARRLRGDPYDTLIPYRTGIHFGMDCHEAANRFWDMCERIKSAGDYDIAYSTRYVLADLIEPERTWQPVTETEPPGKTLVLCKGLRGFPYVASRCTNHKTGELLNNFYVPVAYGGRNQYKTPVMWCPIPTAEKVVNNDN